jgi:hypothetical protein
MEGLVIPLIALCLFPCILAQEEQEKGLSKVDLKYYVYVLTPIMMVGRKPVGVVNNLIIVQVLVLLVGCCLVRHVTKHDHRIQLV